MVFFPSQVLSTLFAVKPELCERKFELKVNDVRFVGHPIQLPATSHSRSSLGGNNLSSIDTIFEVNYSLSLYHLCNRRKWH